MTVVMLLQVNQKCFFPQYGVDYTWGAAGSLRSSILLHLRWKEPVGMEICKWEFKSSLMVPWETKVLILRTFRLAFNQEKKQEVRGWAYSFQSIQFSFRKSSRLSNLFANGLFMYVCAAVCAKYWKQIIWRNFHHHTSFYNHFADVALKFLIFHLSKPEYGSLVISGNTSRTLN